LGKEGVRREYRETNSRCNVGLACALSVQRKGSKESEGAGDAANQGYERPFKQTNDSPGVTKKQWKKKVTEITGGKGSSSTLRRLSGFFVFSAIK